MKKKTVGDQNLVFSYLTLRKAVGILGTALPFLVALGAWLLFQTGLRGSLSGYYYTAMRDVFVGGLCGIGIFLFSYKGYGQADDLAGNLACLFAIGVALFPTTPDDPAAAQAFNTGLIHYLFAACFFATLSYFSLVLFTKTNPRGKPPMTPRKRQRNRVYQVCGYIMIACIVLIGVYSFFLQKAVPLLAAYHPIFWLEAVAIVAFGISWLTKGEALLKDQ